MEKKWEEMTWWEKREERFKRWLSLDIKFESPEAQKLYQERITRFIKIIRLEEPDRVPVALPSGFYPAYYAGYDLKTVMYDYDKLKEAYLKFMREFEMDSFTPPTLVFPSRALEITDHRLHKWPGHGVPDKSSIYQYVEKEYIHADEYNMARAKKILGAFDCIAGNVPASLMHAGSPQDVKEYCRKLIETCAPGGVYILTGAAGMNEGNPYVLRAYMEAAKEYGVY